jgi:hypothetical protein
LEAVAVRVREGQLRARVRALAPHDQPRPFGPGGQVDHVGDLGNLSVLAAKAVPIERRNPAIL